MGMIAQQPVTGGDRRSDAAGLALAVAVAAAVYFPITRNYFAYDDYPHLYHIVNWSPMQFLLNTHGGHLLFTRNAVFLLSYEIFGTNAAGYFWIAFATHLASVGRRTAGLIVPLQGVEGSIYRPRERPRWVVRKDDPPSAPPPAAGAQPQAQP